MHGGQEKFLAHLKTKLAAPDEDEEDLLARFRVSLDGDRDACKRAAEWLQGSDKGSDRMASEAISAFLAGRDPDEELEQLRNALFTKEGEVRANIVTRKSRAEGPAA